MPLKSTPRSLPEGTLFVDSDPKLGEDLIVAGENLGRIIKEPRLRIREEGRSTEYFTWRVETDKGVFGDIQITPEKRAPYLPKIDHAAEVRRLLGR